MAIQFTALILRILSRAMLAGGSMVLVVAVGFTIYTTWFMQRSVKTTGAIVRLQQSADEEGNSLYAPVFAFADANGQSHTITSGLASNPPAFTVGQTVPVLYEPADPSSARILSVGQLFFIPIVCGAVGIVFAPAGYLLFRYEQRRRGSQLEPPGARHSA